MGDFLIPAVVLGVIALLMAAVPSVVLVRRLFLARGVTSFDCSWRPGPGMGSWAYGLARYESDRLEWYRLFALSLRPTWAVHRNDLVILGRRRPEQREMSLMAGDWVLVEVGGEPPGRPQPAAAGSVELAMSEMAYNGLSTWLESAPPGQTHPVT